jgi:hypothetical protein
LIATAQDLMAGWLKAYRKRFGADGYVHCWRTILSRPHTWHDPSVCRQSAK